MACAEHFRQSGPNGLKKRNRHHRRETDGAFGVTLHNGTPSRVRVHVHVERIEGDV